TAAALAADDLEVCADLVGFGRAEVGVEVQGLPEVLPSGDRIAQRVLGLTEAGVGARLLVAVPGLGGGGHGLGVMGDGVGGVAGMPSGLAEAVVDPGLSIALAGLAEDCQRLPVFVDGPRRLAVVVMEVAEAVQRPALAGAVPELPEQVQRLV